MEIANIGIVGAGTMGQGIAQVSIQAGYSTHLVDIDGAALERGVSRIDKGLERLVAKGRLTAEEQTAAHGRLKTGSELAQRSAASVSCRAHSEAMLPAVRRNCQELVPISSIFFAR